MSQKMQSPGSPHGEPQPGVITRSLFWSWLQTLLGIAFQGSLMAAAFYLVGAHWSFGLLFLSIWTALPVLGWYHSAAVVRRLTASHPADPRIPSHRRLIRIINGLYPKTGLPVKPPIYVSPLKIPNAFATGRGPRHSFIAATDGLLNLGLTDDEMEAVLAHELAHVRSYDVAINSLLAVMSSVFAALLATGLPHLFHPATFSSGTELIDKLSDKVREQKKRFFLPVGGVIGFALMLAIFYLVGTFTKFVSLFVTRSRECGADALAVRWTGKPCALSSALQKIVIYTTTHSSDLRNGVITRGMSAVLFVSPLEGDHPNERGFFGTLSKWWRRLGEHHPPVEDRLTTLDRMSGSSCPRVWDE